MRQTFIRCLTCIVAVAAVCAAAAPAAWGLGMSHPSTVYTPERFEIFEPGTRVINTSPNFIGYGYDWTGVGRQATKGLTLISPLHYVMADHYKVPQPTSWIDFSNAQGTLFRRRYAVQSAVSGDLALGTLDGRIAHDAGITYYRILFMGYTGAPYIRSLDAPDDPNSRLELFYFGQSIPADNAKRAIGFNRASNVTAFTSGSGSLSVYGSSTAVDYAHGITGDSGSPSFAWHNGELYLMGTHTSATGDTLVPSRLFLLNQQMAATGYTAAIHTPVTHTWTGAGTNLGAGANWSTGTAPADVLDGTTGRPLTVASLGFNAAHAGAVHLDGSRTVTGLRFTGTGADGYNFSGSHTLTLGEAGIRNESPHTQTFNHNIRLREAQRWEATSGALHVTGAVDNSGYLLMLYGDQNTSLDGPVGGSGGLARDGLGVTRLSGANTYSGTTWVHYGTLLANNATGSATGMGNVIVHQGGRLGGVGTIRPGRDGGLSEPSYGVTLKAGAALAPGDPLVDGGVGALTIGAVGSRHETRLTFEPGARMEFQIGSDGWDQIVLFGDLYVNNTPLDVILTGTPAEATYRLIEMKGLFTSKIYGELTLGSVPDGWQATLDIGPSFVDLHLVAASAIPEPGTLALLAAGVLALARRRRR